MKSYFLLLTFIFASFTAHSGVLAIIDSGVDTKHEAFTNQVWNNPVEIPGNNRDEDRNGYQDDVLGWNFAEGNNEVIDYSYLGTFSDLPYKFFEIQLKMMLGQATSSEVKWMNDIRSDEKAIAELQKFGNFVHGTHVANIASRVNPQSEILSVKLIPTEVKLPFSTGLRTAKDGFRIKMIKGLLSTLATEQMGLLKEISYYLNGHKTKVANGSFGTGTAQAMMIVGVLYKLAFFKDGTKEQLLPLAKHFINALLKEGSTMVNLAPDTFFVFAAGNDGTNNDELPISPANVSGDNVITVAATYERSALAPFSNYGINKVDIAAPGMGINSAIPGGEYLRVSGTSQAAPYVAGIVDLVRSINPALKPVEVKKILLETVDTKEFLKGMVKSEGIVNGTRASQAAFLAMQMDLNEAIEFSKEMVADIPSENLGPQSLRSAAPVLPLPSLFSNVVFK